MWNTLCSLFNFNFSYLGFIMTWLWFRLLRGFWEELNRDWGRRKSYTLFDKGVNTLASPPPPEAIFGAAEFHMISKGIWTRRRGITLTFCFCLARSLPFGWVVWVSRDQAHGFLSIQPFITIHPLCSLGHNVVLLNKPIWIYFLSPLISGCTPCLHHFSFFSLFILYFFNSILVISFYYILIHFEFFFYMKILRILVVRT